MKLKIFAFILALMIFVLPSAVLAADSYQYEWTKVFESPNAYDGIYSSDTDPSGNIFVGGDIIGTRDLDPGPGVDNHTSNGSYDSVITKFSADSTYLWSKTFGGSGLEYVNSLTADKNGNVYATGYFYNTVDFDPGPGVDNHTATGSFDVYLIKINSDGSYGWAKTFGGIGNDKGIMITTDSESNAYLVGYFNNVVDFNPSVTVENHTSNGGSDIFMTKYLSDGTYQWTKTWGSSTGDDPAKIVVSDSQSLYVSGMFGATTDLNPDAGVDTHTVTGNEDLFFSKFQLDGTFIWSKSIGSTGYEFAYIEVDSLENIYLAGYFSGTVDFDPGAPIQNVTVLGTNSIFVAKYNSNIEPVWIKQVGLVGSISAYDLTIDASGGVYVAGNFSGAVDFDPSSQVFSVSPGISGWDAFILALDNNGVFKFVHTTSSDSGFDIYSVNYDSFSNSVYGAGDFGITADFNPLGGHDIKTTDASWSGWVMKLSHVAPLPVLETNHAPGNDPEQAQIPFSDKGNVKGGVLSPAKDSDTGEQKVTVQIEPETLKFNAFLSSVKQNPSELLSSLLPLTTKSNTILTGGNSLGIKTSGGTAWQVGGIQKIFYKAYVPKGSSNDPAVIVPSLQAHPSIISLTYKDLDLIPNGDSKHPFKPTSLKLAYSPDGVTWSIMKSSVVDPTNKTVSAIDKLGGYYMIVSGGSTSLASSKSSSKVLGVSTTAKSNTQTDKVITPSTLLTPTDVTPSPLPTTKSIQIPKPKTCVLWWCW